MSDLSHLYRIDNFDRKKELDSFKQLRERMLKGQMIVDSIQYMHRAI